MFGLFFIQNFCLSSGIQLIWGLVMGFISKAPTQLLAHSLAPVGWGKRMTKAKTRKLMSWDKDSLIGEAKLHMWAKQNKHSLLPTVRQKFCYLLNAGLHQARTPNMLSSSSFPPLFIVEHTIVWSGISLWSVRVICPSYVPSQTLALTQPTHWGMQCEKKKKKRKETSALFKNCSAIANMLF